MRRVTQEGERLLWDKALVLCALTGGVLQGCTPDECPVGVRQCLGNVAETCLSQTDSELSSHTVWERIDCGERSCQTPPAGSPGLAFCALSPLPDPSCPEELVAGREASACIDGVAVTWSYGFRVQEEACAQNEACIDLQREGFDPACGAIAFCSPSTSPDPACKPGVATACEDSETIFYCACGFKKDAHPCSSPGPSCTTVPVGEGVPEQGACR